VGFWRTVFDVLDLDPTWDNTESPAFIELCFHFQTLYYLVQSPSLNPTTDPLYRCHLGDPPFGSFKLDHEFARNREDES
jgi:hypothetical protein